MGDIPNQVQGGQAPAVEGDFASGNPRAFVNAGPGGLVAGPNGAVVARFAWLLDQYLDPNDAPTEVVTSGGTGPIAGIIHRQQQALITTYLAEAGMTIPAGFELALMSEGDIWVVNRGTTAAQLGVSVYANYADGSAAFESDGGSFTGNITAATGNFTGAIADNVLTITAVADGTPTAGATLSGTNVVSGTQMKEQLTGNTTTGIGTWAVEPGGQTVASETIEETYGEVVIQSGLTGTPEVGSVLSGSGVTAGTVITAPIDSTHWAVSPTQSAGNTTISFGTNIKTKFVAASQGAVGALVKITSHLQG